MKRARTGCCCICIGTRPGVKMLGLVGLVLGPALVTSAITGIMNSEEVRPLAWELPDCYHHCVETILHSGKVINTCHACTYSALLPCCLALLASMYFKKDRSWLLFPYMAWLMADIAMGIVDVVFIAKVAVAASLGNDTIAWYVVYWLSVSILKAHYVVAVRTLQKEMIAAANPPPKQTRTSGPFTVPHSGLIQVPGLPGPEAFTQASSAPPPPYRPVMRPLTADLQVDLPSVVT